MKNYILKFSYFFIFFFITFSCSSNKVSYDQVKAKIYGNDFAFIVNNYDTRKTFSTPAGTGRILTNNTQVGTIEDVGVKVSHEKLFVNLPLDKQNEVNVKLKKSNLEFVSYDFTVARKDLDNGKILLNFFLNDQKDVNLIKMEVSKNGQIDASVEGPEQKPLLYLGELRIN